MTVFLPGSDGGHEYDPNNPEDVRRLIEFTNQMSHYVDSGGTIWINKDYPHTDEEDDG